MVNKQERAYRLLALLPKHKGKVRPAMIEAGYTVNTANAKGKKTLEYALRLQAKAIDEESKQIAQNVSTMSITERKQALASIHEKMGLSHAEVLKELEKVIKQDKDYGNKLKALSPLLREQGITLESDAPKITIPVLNIVARRTDLPEVQTIPILEENVDK